MLDHCGGSDPYAPYHAPSGESAGPWNEGYGDYNNSNAVLPLVSNATPFQRPDLYEDDFENKSNQSEDYDARSRFMSQHDDTNSRFGSETYAPSRNMFQNMYTSIRGELFNLSKLTQAHQRVVSVVPSKSILNYGGEAADAIFPVQVCYDVIRVDGV